jgi:hypothetical protein
MNFNYDTPSLDLPMKSQKAAQSAGLLADPACLTTWFGSSLRTAAH